jgi:hypothetical protein
MVSASGNKSANGDNKCHPDRGKLLGVWNRQSVTTGNFQVTGMGMKIKDQGQNVPTITSAHVVSGANSSTHPRRHHLHVDVQVTPMAPAHQLNDIMAGNSFVTNVVSTLSVSKPWGEEGPWQPVHRISLFLLSRDSNRVDDLEWV